LIIFLSLINFNCKISPDVKNYEGSSYQNAIVINADNDLQGTAAVHEWIKSNFPDCQMKSVYTDQKDGKIYDVFTIKTSEGKERIIYFDITKCYVKF